MNVMTSPRCLRASRVFVADGSAPIEDAVVVVSGSRIQAVGKAAEMSDFLAGLPTEVFPECTILPGLVDAHCHLTLAGDRRTYEELIGEPDEMMGIIAVRNLQRQLLGGVTTLRDNGGRNRITYWVREALRRHYFVGPRVLLALRPLTHTYGHFYWCNGEADGIDAIRASVRRLVAEGADHIKLMASGGATAGNIPYYASYTAGELRAAVETAHSLGRLTTAHCRATESIANALDAGSDCIEHAEFLVPGEIIEFGQGVASSGVMRYDAQVGDRLLESGTYVSVTLQSGGYDTLLELRTKSREQPLGDEDNARRAALEAYYEMKLALFSRLIEVGMLPRMVVSSDAGPFDTTFGRLRYGMELAVQGGMTTTQALEAATRVAAIACGVGARVGSIEPGKEADLLIVKGNPIERLQDLEQVVAVFLAGRKVVNGTGDRVPDEVALTTAPPC